MTPELSQVAFAEMLGVKYNQVVGVENGKQQIPGIMLQRMVEIFQVDGHWLLSGEGKMIRNGAVQQNIGGSINYGKDSTVVTTGVNNGHIVAEGGSNTNYNIQGGRGLRLCEFVRWWMANHDDPEDQSWLEKHLERTVPEYAAWKRGL